MRFDFGTNRQYSSIGASIEDIKGVARYGRCIILSEVSSNTIPNILDLIFSLAPGGTDFIPGFEKKTRVMVINHSEIYGDYHGTVDTRTRNAFIHYGIANCSIERINGDTPVIFNDLDWNVIVDKPSEVESGKTWQSIGQVNLSYDEGTHDGTIYRSTNTYKEIIIPDPLHYDEKDQVLLTDNEESYYQYLQEVNESRYCTSQDRYINSLFSCTINELIDKHTKIYKLKIQIENLSNNSYSKGDGFNEELQDLCSNIKYSLEKCGFSAAEVIFNGENGFNVTNLKTYLNLSKIEQHLNYRLLCDDLSDYNEEFMGTIRDFSLMFTIRYDNINITVVDLQPNWGDYNKTDSNVRDFSEMLKHGPQFVGTGAIKYDNIL